MEPTFSTARVIELLAPTGVTPKQFRGWLDAGLILPAEGGGSQGAHRRFTAVQVVGVLVAANVFKGERGCTPSYVGLVVAGFERLGEAKLRERLDQGATHLMHVTRAGDGEPHLGLSGPVYPDMADVAAAYRAVWAEGDRRNHPGGRL